MCRGQPICFSTLNQANPAILFTMETAFNNDLPFIGIEIIKAERQLETCVYRKGPTKGFFYAIRVTVRRQQF